MEFKIIENNDNIVKVSVVISSKKFATDKNIYVDSSDVREFLGANKIRISNCIQETTIDNCSKVPVLEGEWIFQKETISTPKKRKVDATSTTTEEVATRAKSTRRRRPRKEATKENKLL